ncbi:MAG: 50S ribosomal protein L29 [Flavobacteriales bacterium]|nr:MAG: 50S ribosomal protein L29 [Flavobacteriales bacterium]
MKKSDIKELSTADLQDKLVALKKEFSELKITHSVTTLENPMQIKDMRKTIARIATELTNRDLQES